MSLDMTFIFCTILMTCCKKNTIYCGTDKPNGMNKPNVFEYFLSPFHTFLVLWLLPI